MAMIAMELPKEGWNRDFGNPSQVDDTIGGVESKRENGRLNKSLHFIVKVTCGTDNRGEVLLEKELSAVFKVLDAEFVSGEQGVALRGKDGAAAALTAGRRAKEFEPEFFFGVFKDSPSF